jgi:hypothetical protein
MAYLEVTYENTPNGMLVRTANGVSLAQNKGCSAIFSGSLYPNGQDYINALENEGWVLMSTQSSRTTAFIDGLPIINNEKSLIFTGNGRYEIEWMGEKRYFKGSREDCFE